MNKVALVIGHNAKSQGAFEKSVGTEFQYYSEICKIIKELDEDNRIDVFERPSGMKTYGAEMRAVLEDMKATGENYQLVMELHFNAADNIEARGAEVLAYIYSKLGVPLAKEFLNRLNKEYGMYNRGVLGIRDSSERGGYGIMNSPFPYILIEPFFCTNPKEVEKFINKEKFAKFILDFIKEM